MEKAADIVWEEWRREPNGFDIEEAIEIEDVGYSRYWQTSKTNSNTNNRKEVFIETFKTLDRLYKSIEDLANIFYTKDNNVTNEDVHESIEKVIDTYTELKNTDEDEDELI